MTPKLLFFDIDGTLKSEVTKKIPQSAIDAVKKAQANGHLCFINTGRTYKTMPDDIREIEFDGYLCGCGTRIVYHDEVLKAKVFTPEEVSFLIDALQTYGVEAFLEGSEDVYCQSNYRQPLMNHLREEFKKLGFCNTPMESKNFPFDKFCLMTDGQDDLEGFFKAVAHLIDPIDRGNHFYECVPKGITKATAIQDVMVLLQVPVEDTYAFGDSTNDLSMFEICGHCIAMGEHAKELEPYTEFITDTCENDGIEKALRHYGFID